jgi:hypothetical protein
MFPAALAPSITKPWVRWQALQKQPILRIFSQNFSGVGGGLISHSHAKGMGGLVKFPGPINFNYQVKIDRVCAAKRLKLAD